jgi:hypothetical protein
MPLISLPKKIRVFFLHMPLIQIRIKIWNFFYFLLPLLVCGSQKKVLEMSESDGEAKKHDKLHKYEIVIRYVQQYNTMHNMFVPQRRPCFSASISSEKKTKTSEREKLKRNKRLLEKTVMMPRPSWNLSYVYLSLSEHFFGCFNGSHFLFFSSLQRRSSESKSL